MNYKYNFTFIIPHKNLPELLHRCVSSIPRRSDTEIIIVDDNSDEDIVDFDNFPFLREPNIKIIFDKSGLRQGHARNIGLQHAEGKWIIFADSDDFFFYSIDKAMNDCLNSDADIIYYKSTNLDSNTYKSCGDRAGLTNKSIDLYLKNDSHAEEYIRYRHPVPWGKFIRSSVIRDNNIIFPEVIKAEDVFFSVCCGYYAKKIEVHDISIYCLTSREGNVSSLLSPEALFALVSTETNVLLFMKNHNIHNNPIFKMWEMDVFSSVNELRSTNEKFYNESIDYLIKKGLSQEYIYQKLRFIRRGAKRAKFLASMPLWLRKCYKK